MGTQTGRAMRRAITGFFASMLAVSGATIGVLGTAASTASAATLSTPAFHTVEIAPHVPDGATKLGPLSAATEVHGDVVLSPRNPTTLQTFIAQATDPSSPQFHHYLAPGQFAATFGPSAATITAVTQQLRTDGLHVGSVARDGVVVSFSGAASTVESAFHTSLARYKLADGKSGFATTTAVQLPTSIAKSVVAVVGLDNLVHAQSAGPIRPPSSMKGTYPAAATATFTHPAGSASPCATATGAATAYGGLTDDQIAHAYGAFGLYTKGDFATTQTIAVFELGPFSRTYAHTFDSCYFPKTAAAMTAKLHTQTTTATLAVDGGQPKGSTAEASLDVQDVSAIAPGATIDVYQAPNTTFGSLDEYSAIVNQDKAQVVTTSWGLCEQAVQLGEPGVQQAENILFEQAAAQGQSVFAAAGDTGSNDCNAFRFNVPMNPVLSVDDPASQPYVVAVGGTTITNATQPPQEQVWNDGATWGAGGGGISQSWPMPTWQLDSGVPGVDPSATVTAAETFQATGFCHTTTTAGTFVTACREVPDVSAQADEFTGAITMYTQTLTPVTGWFTIGGTSSATPIWAALVALVNDSGTSGSVCSGTGGVGFVSPLLYAVAHTPDAYAASFTDVTAGNNDPYGASQLFPATKGYDMASGLGSPELTNPTGVGLAYHLCNLAASPSRPVVTRLTPTSAPTFTTPHIHIYGTGLCTGTTSLVKDVTIGTVQLPVTTTTSTVTSHCATSPPYITAWGYSAATLSPPGDTTDGAGAYQVIVTLTDGQSSVPTPASVFTYLDETSGTTVPDVTSVRTYGGPHVGGNTVDIFGTGFTTVTLVSFGGVPVPAATFTIVSPWEIQATAPAYTATLTTCAQNGSSLTTANTATTDICQVAVVVGNTTGPSSNGSRTACRGTTTTNHPILPAYEGAYAVDTLGVIPAPAGEEAAPQPCEYDYFPQPTITSISTTTTGLSESAGGVVTLHGSGFNLFGLDSVSVGTPTLASSQDFTLLYVSGTELQLAVHPITQTVNEATVPIEVKTLGGTSASATVTYVGVPVVTKVVATTPTLKTKPGAPDTGGTPITISGEGFTQANPPLVFVDAGTPFSLGTQYNAFSVTPTTITTTTVPQNPAFVHVEVCSLSGCSTPTPTSEFILFPPGAPVVDSVTPASGSKKGGTTVVITGENLGCVTSVTIAGVPTKTYSNAAQILDCGSTTTVDAQTAPNPGAPHTGPVKVTTIESAFMGTAPVSHATFTYGPTARPGGGGTPPPPSPIATRVAGSTADGTAAAEFTRAFPATKGACPTSRTAVLATTKTFQDALSSQFLAESLTTGTLLTPTGTLSTATKNALKAEGISTVYVVGGHLAVSTTVVHALEALPAYSCGGTNPTGTITVHRIAGTTAYGTAEAVAEQVGSAPSKAFAGAYTTTNTTGGTGAYNDTAGMSSKAPTTSAKTAILASGTEFQDAQAASVIAYHTKMPLLLTSPSSLSTTATAAIQKLGVTQVIMVGGQDAVSNGVESALVAKGVSVLRIAGKDYTDTARELARFEAASAPSGLGWTFGHRALVARGNGFTDGLAGAVLDSAHNAATGTTGGAHPLLLTESQTVVGTYLTTFLKVTGHTGVDGTATKTITDLTVLGGPLALSTATVAAMQTDLSH